MTEKRQFIEMVQNDAEMPNALDVADLMAELETEIQGFTTYLSLLGTILKSRYPRHRKMRKLVEKQKHETEIALVNLRKLQIRYRSKIYDFEHRNGKLERKPMAALTPFAMSFEQLLETFPADQILEEFLDD